MAEADVSEHRYFCHQCNREVQPVMPDYVCSRCESGFIEEMENQVTQQPQNDIGRALFGQFLQQNMGMPTESSRNDAAENFVDEWDDLHSDRVGPSRRRPHRRSYHTRSRSNGPSVVFSFGGQQRVAAGEASGGGDDMQVDGMVVGGPAGMDMFVQQLFNNLGITVVRGAGGGGGLGQFGLNGVLGDYALGNNGLDNIITQLLNQLDNTGPPPADKTTINSLPIKKVTQEMIDENCECSVCREEYSLDEDVKSLPCKHLFHPACVDPWLDMHDSCPICRCNLNGEQPKADA